MRSILWFRGHDLRLRDHRALQAAARAERMICVFFAGGDVLGPGAERPHHRQFLLDALVDLSSSLASRGSQLVVAEGDAIEQLPALARRWRIDVVHGLAAYDPRGRAVQDALGTRLEADLELHDGYTLHDPGSLRTGSHAPYSVFTPFARAFRARVPIAGPGPAPRRLPPLPEGFEVPATAVDDLTGLGPVRNERIQPGGEQAGRARLRKFLDIAADYPEHRDRMDLEGTSRLSADLKFGTLSPRQVWAAVADAAAPSRATAVFQNELIWREFNVSTLFDRPELAESPFRADWAGFDWREDDAGWAAWVHGRTGYPVVDASARQLLAEGFVHNRARMISASFLTKHLLVDYARGEAHYMEHLTDGEPAQNLAGWQWSAGCGCDAQPWFRIFNPVTQGRKFDPDGDYVRRWVPELRQMDGHWIHHPWEAPPEALESAGVRLGEDYPRPIVDHREARERFLARAKAHLDRGR